MSYPRPVLIPARSAVVRRNPNLLTWLRNAEEAAPNQIPYSGETVPSLSPPSWAETIVRRVREWDEAQEVDPEERKLIIKLSLLTPTKLIVRVDATSNSPHFRPRAGDFYGLRIVYSVVPKVEEDSDRQCYEGETDVTVQREEGRWHGVAELAIPSDMGRGYETFAKIVRAI